MIILFLFFAFTASAVNSCLIDIHTHIGSFRGFEIGERFLLENMNRYNVQYGLVSNIDGANLPKITRNLAELKTNQETAAFVKRHPKQFRGLLWARPKDGSASNLEKMLTDQKGIFAGIKFHPEFNQFSVEDELVEEYLKLCEKHKLVAVFHTGRKGSNSDPEKIYALARQHPTVPFILYHMGFLGPHDNAIRVAARSREKRDAKIYLETAQAEIDAVLLAIDKLGSDAVLFGTDATYYGRDHYARYQKLLKTLREKLTSADYFRVTAGNAIRIFSLSELPAGPPCGDLQSETAKMRGSLFSRLR
jgi:predicted TIM-barrel fold metal-dependent hydrolase